MRIFHSSIFKKTIGLGVISADKASFRLMAFVFAFVAIPLTASAGMAITEIMYDVPGTDTGHEWVEVENTGVDAIDFSTWKFFEANTNHKISAIGASTIPSGGFAVVADNPDKFRSDNPGFSGSLFDSAFSLSNDGETIALHDEAGAVGDSVSYIPAWGAGGDGNSLQKTVSGSWISALPTIGSITSANTSEAPIKDDAKDTSSISDSDKTSANDAQGQEAPSDAYSSQEIAANASDEPELVTTAGRARFGFVGSPLSFRVKMKSLKNISPIGNSLASLWSMGDGTELSGSNVQHTYQYPGDYVVIVNSDYGGAHAVSKVPVKIVDPSTRIKSVASSFIEIANPDTFEMNLGGYVLANDKGRFVIPQDTIISPRSSIKLPYLNIKLAFGGSITLFDPSGRQRSQFTESVIEPLIALPQGFDIEAFKERFDALINGDR